MGDVKDLEALRPVVGLVSIAAGILLIVILYLTLPEHAAKTLLDRGQTFPYSVQSGMWIVFAIGLGELAIRMMAAQREMRQLRMQYLPEDPRIVLQSSDLPGIYRK